MFTVRCDDLGVKDCDFEVQGETPADIVDRVTEHLAEHGIDLPSTEEILGVGESLSLIHI